MLACAAHACPRSLVACRVPGGAQQLIPTMGSPDVDRLPPSLPKPWLRSLLPFKCWHGAAAASRHCTPALFGGGGIRRIIKLRSAARARSPLNRKGKATQQERKGRRPSASELKGIQNGKRELAGPEVLLHNPEGANSFAACRHSSSKSRKKTFFILSRNPRARPSSFAFGSKRHYRRLEPSSAPFRVRTESPMVWNRSGSFPPPFRT